MKQDLIQVLEKYSRRQAISAIGATTLGIFASCKNKDENQILLNPSPINKITPDNPTPNSKCPYNGTIGNTSFAPQIKILGLSKGDYLVRGNVNNINASLADVVLWAWTDRWYVQPTAANPRTSICDGGIWQNETHAWDKITALLVDKSYAATQILDRDPKFDRGVLAFDEFSAIENRIINFSGYSWNVKGSNFPVGPGPNYFSTTEYSVSTDSAGLHLRTKNIDGKWNCAEVVLDRSLGYGEYTYELASRVDTLDFQTTFSGFLYENMNREIDIEFSKVLANPNNAQFVIQPYTTQGNIIKFDMPPVASSHRINWKADKIEFTSWRGLDNEPNSGNIIKNWIYRGQNIPPPGGERMRFNLWFFNGIGPNGGQEDEAIIKSFKHKP